MTFENDPRLGRTSDDTGWIIGGLIGALMVIGALYWANYGNSITASSGGNAPASQTTGSNPASKNTTTGSGGAAR
jgi:transcription elongation factor